MKALLALFAKSPFRPLQAHMEKVRACVDRLAPLFDAVFVADEEAQKKLVDEICRIESEADVIKNDIRDHLPKSMFLPIDRGDLLEILQLQDAMADGAQDVAITVTLRRAFPGPSLEEPLRRLVKEVTRVCSDSADILQQVDELLETTFRGKEAERVLGMIAKLNTDETIADDVGISLARKIFSLEGELGPVDVMFWFHVSRQIGQIANLAEGIGNRLRLLLAK